MNKIVIIGGGFGGLSAASALSGRGLDVTLIDKKTTQDFLPLLPDVIGRGIAARALSYPLENAAKRSGFKFVSREATALDPDKRELMTSSGALLYDYLIIASGSETNFYGQKDAQQHSYKLDSVMDAQRMSDAVRKDIFENFIVSGGGYTGVEVATNLKAYLTGRKPEKNVIIVERAPSLLGPLPQRLKDYALSNLDAMGVRAHLNATIAKVEPDKVYLSSGEIYGKAMLIWTAGVRTDNFIQKLNYEKNPQGRLKVDGYLRVSERIFAVGDVSNAVYEGKPLRMSVQFAITQGACAAGNILRHIKGAGLKKYAPLDPGYIVPMANNRSCGLIFGAYLSGMPATVLHYLMCLYRAPSFKNRSGIIKGLISGR